jgi:predicted RNase H-like HicB family nuclease
LAVLRLAVEDMEPGHWVAWVLDLPGCFGSGASAEAAVGAAAGAMRVWRGRLGMAVDEGEAVEVVERFASFMSAPEYRVNAFFADDERALDGAEVERGLRMLEITRAELLVAVPGEPTGETARVLEHVARAEWWYLTRLGSATGEEAVPAEPLARVEAVRAMTRAALPGLLGDGRVVELNGERWSGRKVLRRALWHEQDHAAEIARAIVDA